MTELSAITINNLLYCGATKTVRIPPVLSVHQFLTLVRLEMTADNGTV